MHFSGNRRALLSYLNTLTAVPSLEPIFSDLNALGQSQLRAALDSISPARNGALASIANQVMFGIGRVAENQQSMTRILCHRLQCSLNPKGHKSPNAQKTKAAQDQYSLRATGWGDFLSQGAQNQNPKISAAAGGVLVGFDSLNCELGMFSLSAGYVNIHVDEAHHVGSSTSQGGVLSIYGTRYIGNHGYIEIGALGGYNLVKNQRNVALEGPAPFHSTAKSSYHNWQVMPQLGGGYDHGFCWGGSWIVIESFVQLDYALTFEPAYRESGAAPLNMQIGSSSPSILESRAGLNLYETIENEGSLLGLRESLSYVNKVFFGTRSKGSIVNAPGSFTVETYNQTLNLFAIGGELFYKRKVSGFSLSLSYNGEFGKSYISNEGQVALGLFF
jgi:uncharacterized protein with beta-barrel porin domain